MDFTEPFPDAPDVIANQAVPLRLHGPNLDDFLEAVIEHPTKYAEFKRINDHAESRREPLPDRQRYRVNPAKEFVVSHARFLYVTGMPHPVFDDELGTFDNPLHRHRVAETAANLFGVPVLDVSPANMTSAFIGFDDPVVAKEKRKQGPNKEYLGEAVVLSNYNNEGEEGDDATNVETNKEHVVRLENLPAGWSAAMVARNLIPPQMEMDPVKEEDVVLLSPTTALVTLESAARVEQLTKSLTLPAHLEEMGKSHIRYFKAKREIVFAGYDGPAGGQERKVKGERLIVDGDVPSKDFFVSHAAVLHLRNLHPNTTKEDIAAWAQPYCDSFRDVQGSVEFVTCYRGKPTGKAYVGFDRKEEATNLLRACSGFAKIPSLANTDYISSNSSLRMVKERKVRRGLMHDERPRRPVETLLQELDSSSNWEKHVDPNDILQLERAGIRKDILDDTFDTIRRHNRTFAIEDTSIRGERVNNTEEMGHQFKTFVRMYIETLKECVSTPERPGNVYEDIHYPGEELDLSIFDLEKERQKKLLAFEEKKNNE
eukprot:CAMPEP_0118684008 /NCGR_PEP_ID=MMETSP0800-20121206/6390_1 /TAXON_ID=210618 ORGANISM="Striatella unipunctata, Strain CCMP2910" /NCGR_SAMPLE_ID=MMETSP0800 /ASSEMBLY_ACC=CAM_ASM_000638 /LENGTH=541 /DNA_ID=CAMNT_0006580637 /DNA_START=270 /DNA_END=1895 /DNA_ORIENTATION=+